MGQLNEGQRILEQSSVSQVAILQDAVVEGAHYLYFLLVDQAVSDSYNGLLHFLCEVDATSQQVHLVLVQV